MKEAVLSIVLQETTEPIILASFVLPVAPHVQTRLFALNAACIIIWLPTKLVLQIVQVLISHLMDCANSAAILAKPAPTIKLV